jgi:hypothetical protein
MTKITFIGNVKSISLIEELNRGECNSDFKEDIHQKLDDSVYIQYITEIKEDVSDMCDILLVWDWVETEKYKKLGYNAHWFPPFADTNIFYPMDINIEYTAVTNKRMGNPNFLYKLIEHSQGMIGDMGPLELSEHCNFINKGMMVVNNSLHGDISDIILQSMACGKLVLTDRLKSERKLDELFVEGREIVFYDDIVDCINKINFFVEHEIERDSIAKSGMDKVLENHTQKQRVDLIIDKWLN